MTPALERIAARELVFRIGRGPDPWAFPDWSRASPDDGTFGHRYDDPLGHYRVLYASSQRLATLVETLAHFRPDPSVLAAVIEEGGGEPSTVPAGHIKRDWLAPRVMGVARIAGSFADIGHASSIEHLRRALADRVLHYGLRDLDAAAIRMSVPRRFTQEISRHVFEHSEEGQRAFAGICYRSRLGDGFENWALFEPAQLEVVAVEALLSDDPDLQRALELLGLQIV